MEDELKDEVQGLRRPENRSLLNVNEDFQGKRNAEIHLFIHSLIITPSLYQTPRAKAIHEY